MQKECQLSSKSDEIKDLRNCSNITFKNVSDFNLTHKIDISQNNGFVMIGDESGTIIWCSGSSGIILTDVANILLANLQFHQCGVQHPHRDFNFNAAILMVNCSNVHINNTLLNRTNGTGLVLLNSNGYVQISNSGFHSEKLKELEDNITSGGGGMHIQQFPTGEQEPFSVNISIDQCNFSNNIATTYCNLTACESSCSFGYGGGLTISGHNSSHYAEIMVKDSNFWKNSATAGGGVEVIVCNSQNTNFFFSNISFDNNEAREEGGGALDILWSLMYNSKNTMVIKDVDFYRNYAKYGGGSAIAIASNSSISSNNYIKFTGCIWKDNIALYGSAIDIIFPKKIAERQLINLIEIEDSIFTNNSNCDKPMGKFKYIQGFGVIMITGYKLLIRGNATFSSNMGSCIFAVGSEVIFIEANVLFEENIAEYGSGISLVGLSIITTKDNCSIQFCNNRAEKNAPTVFYYPIDKHNLIQSKRYMFEALNIKGGNTHFQELGNSRPQSLKYIDGEDIIVNFTNTGVLRGLKFTSSKRCRKNPASSTLKNMPRCRDHCKYPRPNPLIFIPGIEKEFYVSQNPGLLRVTLYRNGFNTVKVPDIYEYISNKLKVNGCPGSEVLLYLHDNDFHDIHYKIPLKLTGCPPLHKLSNDSQCQCYTRSDSYFSTSSYKCDHTTNYSYSSIIGGYWVGYENSSDYLHSRFLMGYCPTGFCNQGSNDFYWLTLPFQNGVNQDELDEVLCNNRQGILCGKCRNGTTVYIHSRTYKCGNTDKCGLGALLFLLAEIIPITAIFLVLILLKMKLTTGGLTGFIFFAQVYESVNIELEGYIKDGITYNYRAFHHLVYQFFNFDFAELDDLSFCLSENITALEVLALKYAVSIYALMLVLTTIFLIRFCSRFRFAKYNCGSYSIMQVISTFIVIVYSKCTYVSFSILFYKNLYHEKTSVVRVVALQGTMEYFGSSHLPYAIAALLVLFFFILPLPLLLLFYPLSNKVVSWLGLDDNYLVRLASRLVPLFKLLPLFDCFQGTFKDNYRFFSGLYFIFRVSILSSLFAPEISLVYFIVTMQLIVMLTFHTLAWPYKCKIHNIIDALLFANLAIISGLKLLMIVQTKSSSSSSYEIRYVHIMEIILVNIPIFVVIVYLLVKGFVKFNTFCRNKKFKLGEYPLDTFLSDDIREEKSEDDYYLMH